MRKFSTLLVSLLVVCSAGTVLAATASERPFSPVQNGPVTSAPMVQQWVPGRLVIQFTPEGLQRASLPQPGDKSAGTVSRTGINSLDLALDATSVTGIRVAYPKVANKTMAAAVGADRWYILDLAPGTDVPAAAKRLAQDANLAYALPDLIAFPAVAPDDPLHADNWGHNNTAQLPDLDWGGTYSHTLPTTVGTPGFDTNAQAAWNGSQGYGDPNVVIAILDSGVDAGHPDLTQVTGYDFGDDDNNPTDDSAEPGHGTACAGIAAATANNNLGAVGVAGGSSIMPLKVADSDGSMFYTAITSAVYYAADNGADVISMSFGSTGTSYAPMDNAITYAYNKGVVLLAATGNENNSQISYPAYNPKVIGVGAASPCGDRKRSGNANEVNPGITPDPNGYTCDGERWWGSNYGSSIQDHQGAVDILAPTILPTTDIQGTGGYDPGDYSSFFNGTSCATPYAAGVCALIKGANPTFTPLEVWTQLTASAQDIVNVESGAGWDRYSGYGMVDAAAAVGAVIPPAVQAAFTASETTGCTPLTVNFTDMSIGNPTEWLWNFGGIGISTLQNPSYTFTAPGVYDVTLSIVAPEGGNTLVRAGYITVGTVPGVSFTPSSMTFITAGDSITFNDTSTGDPIAWVWDFGDGGTDTVQNPTHVFNVSSVYSIKLVATNACGVDSVTVSNLIIVTNPPAPVAAFSYTPDNGCAPLAVTFTDETTGTPTAWLWNFGDGATDTAASPVHTFTAAGVYDVSLIASNAGGADTLSVAGAVTVGGPPVVSYTISDTTISVGGIINFTDTSTGAPNSWTWDFGDGDTDIAQNPSHQYTTPGVFTVSLIAGNACGTDTLQVVDQITVANLATPVAAFSLTPATGCTPLEVTFTDESLNDVGSWSWSFGDGVQDTLQNPIHTYNAMGTYDVQLIVAGVGGVDTLTVAGAVVVNTPVTAAFSVSDTLAAPPLDVTFTDASTGNPTSWLWDFGDATTDTVASPVHTYTVDGLYDVTLIVSNSCSTDTLTLVGAVHINSLSAVGGVIPARFGLEQNYPNPFNPSTTFVYSLEKPGHARLEVYDVSGRRVATLVDGDKATGRHEITWRPREIASGVYFSRLTVGNETATKRVTLLK